MFCEGRGLKGGPETTVNNAQMFITHSGPGRDAFLYGRKLKWCVTGSRYYCLLQQANT